LKITDDGKSGRAAVEMPESAMKVEELILWYRR
jgi:hypothetical protein